MTYDVSVQSGTTRKKDYHGGSKIEEKYLRNTCTFNLDFSEGLSIYFYLFKDISTLFLKSDIVPVKQHLNPRVYCLLTLWWHKKLHSNWGKMNSGTM